MGFSKPLGLGQAPMWGPGWIFEYLTGKFIFVIIYLDKKSKHPGPIIVGRESEWLHLPLQFFQNLQSLDLFTLHQGILGSKSILFFIRPRYTWGLIYGSESLSLTHYTFMQVIQVLQVIQVIQVIDSTQRK